MVHVATLHPGGNTSYASGNDLDLGRHVDLLGSNDTNAQGSLTNTSPAGALVTVTYMARTASS